MTPQEDWLLVVTFVIDDKYINQLLFVIYRCISTAKKKHEYVVFFSDLSEISVHRIKEFSSLIDSIIQLVQISEQSTFFDNGHIARSSMLRLKVPQYLDKIYMHLDVDTLPLKGWDDIELYNPTAKEVISAVALPLLYTDRNTHLNEAIKVMGPDYFQTGIYLLNPTKWSELNFELGISSAITEYSVLGFQFSDQCILNYTIQKRYRKLPVNFNTFPGQFRLNETRIIHFAGLNKPWLLNYATYFAVSLRHVISIRQTLAYIYEKQIITAMLGFRARLSHFFREFFCLILYKISYEKFRRLFY
jgi:lipopolysaccharide biosynthesis glycosyltransferase